MDRADDFSFGSILALDVGESVIAADLLHLKGNRAYTSMPGRDPLRDQDALHDAALVDLRFDATALTLGLLFDLRGAIEFQSHDDPYVGILVARGVVQFDWTNPLLSPRSKPPDHQAVLSSRQWHATVSSVPTSRDGRFSLRITTFSDIEIRLEADTAEFYGGDMPGMDRPPPDFMEHDDAVIRAGLPQWSTPFTLTVATILSPEGAP